MLLSQEVFGWVFYFYTWRHSVLKLWCNNSDFVHAVQHFEGQNIWIWTDGRNLSLNKMRLSALCFQVAVTRPLLCPFSQIYFSSRFGWHYHSENVTQALSINTPNLMNIVISGQFKHISSWQCQTSSKTVSWKSFASGEWRGLARTHRHTWCASM